MFRSDFFLRKCLLCTLIFLTGCSSIDFGSSGWKVPKGGVGKSKGFYKVGAPYQVKGVTYRPSEDYGYDETGIASWYGPGFHGKSTANGETFDTRELTAAHRTLPMPSLVRVTNLENGHSVVVRINDRGPFAHGRIIDLSQKAADLLGYRGKGTAKVRVKLLPEESRKLAQLAMSGQSTVGAEKQINGQGMKYASHNPNSVPTPYNQNNQSSTIPVSISSSKETHVAGHTKRGVFYPDPVVSHTQVVPTTIFIQAGSFSVIENAQAVAQKLQPIGPARVHEVYVSGKHFYRVRIAADDIPTADILLKKVEKAGYKDAIIVVD